MSQIEDRNRNRNMRVVTVIKNITMPININQYLKK